MNGSGVIFEFPTPHSKLQSCFPGLQKLKPPPETSYALLTCHHTIPDGSQISLQGWSIFVGPGKKMIKLDTIVCGAVSCCGEDGIISFSSKKSEVAVLLPHQTGCCKLKLDFTILFLNQYFERQFVKRGNASSPRPLKIKIPSDSADLSDLKAVLRQIECTSNTEADTKGRLYLCHREEGEVVCCLPVKIEQGVTAHSDASATLRLDDEINVYRKLQKICYIESEASGEIIEGYSGSALVYYDPDTNDPHLVGIHVGVDETTSGETRWYIGLTIHTILQLLRGNTAAFFALMKHPPARKMWPYRWQHLLTHTLDSQLQVKHKWPWGYLVEIVHLLLEKSKGTRLIRLDIQDPPKATVAALCILSTVFKCFEISGHADVAATLSGDGGVFTSVQALESFKTDVRELSCSLPNLLTSAVEGREEDLEITEAGFECYNAMLNFKYEDIVGSVLYMSENLTYLGHLRQKYPSPALQRNFSDILLKCRLIMENKHKTEIDQLKEEFKKQKGELEDQLQNQSIAEQELTIKYQEKEKENHCLTHDAKKLMEERSKDQQKIKQLQEELAEERERHHKSTNTVEALRGELEQSKQAVRELEGKLQNVHEVANHMCDQQKLHVEKVEAELRETNRKLQTLNESLTTVRAEEQKWRYRTAESERRVGELSEEIRRLQCD